MRAGPQSAAYCGEVDAPRLLEDVHTLARKAVWDLERFVTTFDLHALPVPDALTDVAAHVAEAFAPAE
jgi:hypothetical protein